MEKLTPKEEEIMRWFWSKGPLFVKELQELYPEPRPHFNTLSTLVRLLEQKGYVAHKAYGKTYQYYACVAEDEFRKSTLKDVVRKYFADSYLQAVSTLVQDNALSDAEIEELTALVKNLRSKGDSKKKGRKSTRFEV
ncbi:MAG: BlaI/MecI/CopY family transcriptional regulator [Bacteroidetes bacterium]|uniref:BlaI/MecI/CopY family transcriptional regulator n=1 Tax=Candidatus Pullibacteroides excrementavium TaxID=2840905 RepID=A0A9D9DQ55_9BACT|nr:BlaI/MecI/CopY family transcriptional regulator [Candidatus Pullibacteroides excrementavium]